jgi:DNA-binding XRE family transcriptional regulator
MDLLPHTYCMDPTEVGSAVRRARELLSLSVDEAAAVAEVNRQTWYDLEAGKARATARTKRGVKKALRWDRWPDDVGTEVPREPGPWEELMAKNLGDLAKEVRRLRLELERRLPAEPPGNERRRA